MTFCGVNTVLFEGVPCIPALLSAAEMLQQRNPPISNAFIKYAAGLIENYLAQMGSTPELDEAFAPLAQRTQSCQFATVRDLERFGDALVAAADGATALDFHKLAYLCYTATSVHGAMTSRILQKMTKAEQTLNADEPGFAAPNYASVTGNTRPAASTFNDPSFTPPGYPSVHGPPVFTPNAGGAPPGYPNLGGGPPVFTPNAGAGGGGPPVFTPSGPPVFTPGPAPSAGGPPVFTPSGPPVFSPGPAPSAGGPPVFTPSGPPAFTPGPAGPPVYGGGARASTRESGIQSKSLQLAELAESAFKAGANEIALTAIMAAINELQKA